MLTQLRGAGGVVYAKTLYIETKRSTTSCCTVCACTLLVLDLVSALASRTHDRTRDRRPDPPAAGPAGLAAARVEPRTQDFPSPFFDEKTRIGVRFQVRFARAMRHVIVRVLFAPVARKGKSRRWRLLSSAKWTSFYRGLAQ